MTDISKASPRPWHVYESKYSTRPGIESGQGSVVVYGTDEDDAGVDGGKKPTPERIEANAALIVRAVNSHKALIEALEKLVRMTKFELEHNAGREPWTSIIKRSEDALTLAKGE